MGKVQVVLGFDVETDIGSLPHLVSEDIYQAIGDHVNSVVAAIGDGPDQVGVLIQLHYAEVLIDDEQVTVITQMASPPKIPLERIVGIFALDIRVCRKRVTEPVRPRVEDLTVHINEESLLAMT